jgi:hypothetical protein
MENSKNLKVNNLPGATFLYILWFVPASTKPWQSRQDHGRDLRGASSEFQCAASQRQPAAEGHRQLHPVHQRYVHTYLHNGVFTQSYILPRCGTARHTKIRFILLLSYDKFMPYGTNSLICIRPCTYVCRYIDLNVHAKSICRQIRVGCVAPARALLSYNNIYNITRII